MIINDIDALAVIVEELKSSGQRVVFTNGVFDLMHVGHLRYLSAARALGDVLVVAVNADASVQRLKGPSRPVVNQGDRQEMLDGLRCVDYVTLFDLDTPVALVKQLQPDIYAKGGDYTIDNLPEAPIVHAYGGKVAILPFVVGQSSTSIIEKILSANSGHLSASSDESGIAAVELE